MGKIYTIAYLPKAESRENILNSILGEEENENFEWILTKTSVRISKKILKSRIYKTRSGAAKYCDTLNKMFNDPRKEIRLDTGYSSTYLPYPVSSRSYWSINKIHYDPSYHFKVVEITDEWNEQINKKLEKLKSSYEKEKANLLSKLA